MKPLAARLAPFAFALPCLALLAGCEPEPPPPTPPPLAPPRGDPAIRAAVEAAIAEYRAALAASRARPDSQAEAAMDLLEAVLSEDPQGIGVAIERLVHSLPAPEPALPDASPPVDGQ